LSKADKDVTILPKVTPGMTKDEYARGIKELNSISGRAARKLGDEYSDEQGVKDTALTVVNNDNIIKKGAVAAVILATTAAATAGVIKVLNDKKTRAAGNTVNVKKSRDAFQEWKKDNEDVIRDEIALRKAELTKAQKIINAHFGRYSNKMAFGKVQSIVKGNKIVAEFEPSIMKNSWVNADKSSMNISFSEFINPNYNDLWDIGISALKPIGRLCAFITNPLGAKNAAPIGIPASEVEIINNFKKYSKELYHAIKNDFDKSSFQCISLKFETYTNGANSPGDFAFGVELKARNVFN
jgi:hypothetical protein